MKKRHTIITLIGLLILSGCSQLSDDSSVPGAPIQSNPGSVSSTPTETPDSESTQNADESSESEDELAGMLSLGGPQGERIKIHENKNGGNTALPGDVVRGQLNYARVVVPTNGGQDATLEIAVMGHDPSLKNPNFSNVMFTVGIVSDPSDKMFLTSLNDYIFPIDGSGNKLNTREPQIDCEGILPFMKGEVSLYQCLPSDGKAEGIMVQIPGTDYEQSPAMFIWEPLHSDSQ